jgi:hypothetical protein
MRAARELAKKAANHKVAANSKQEGPSGEEKAPGSPPKDRTRSEKEIKGKRSAGKKGETSEQRLKRIHRKWRRGIYKAVAQYRIAQLDDLKHFRYATKLPPKNEKGRARFGQMKKIQELEEKLELVALRENQLKFVEAENIRLQFRIGIALTKAESYLEAQPYLERVTKNVKAYKETPDEKSSRIKLEMAIAKERGKLQIQLEFEAEEAAATAAKRAKAKAAAARKKGGPGATDEDKKVEEAAPIPAKKPPRVLEEEKEGQEDEEEEQVHPSYDTHMWAGRCAVGMFKVTKMHYHLETAYGHYLRSIECMTVPNESYDLSTKLRLPIIYLELGQLFEKFGSMESALNMYSRSMNEFPDSRHYFDTMHRSVLVGRHLMAISTNEKGKEDMLNRCVDMLQFLLEALPVHLDETCTYYVLCSFSFISLLVTSLSLYRSISACLHSLTPHDTSLTIIPPTINHQHHLLPYRYHFSLREDTGTVERPGYQVRVLLCSYFISLSPSYPS